METKDIILKLRTDRDMSQDELAEKLFVTRQAVSRWENGDTVPNTETLKLLSALFDVSINTLLGSPRRLICQCCGMPLDDDAIISHEPDGELNEDYCKWCYSDGNFVYASIEQLTDFLVGHMSNEQWPPEQARAYFETSLPKLKHWTNEEGKKAPTKRWGLFLMAEKEGFAFLRKSHGGCNSPPDCCQEPPFKSSCYLKI